MTKFLFLACGNFLLASAAAEEVLANKIGDAVGGPNPVSQFFYELSDESAEASVYFFDQAYGVLEAEFTEVIPFTREAGMASLAEFGMNAEYVAGCRLQPDGTILGPDGTRIRRGF